MIPQVPTLVIHLNLVRRILLFIIFSLIHSILHKLHDFLFNKLLEVF